MFSTFLTSFFDFFRFQLNSSASFNAITGECSLSDMDRFSVTARSAYSTTPDVDYFETNCADDPVKMCDFQKTEGRILKTVDAVYQVSTAHPSKPLAGQSSPFVRLAKSFIQTNRTSRTRRLVNRFASIPTSAVTRSTSEIPARKSAGSAITRPAPSVKFR